MHGSGSATDRLRPAAGALAAALLRLLPALLLLAALPAAARAHTRLESSSPAADAVLRTPPAELRLRFSAPVEPRLTGATLLAASGDTVLVAMAAPEPGSGNRAFVLPLPAALAPGEYLVEWRTAGADGHVIQGGFSFVVEGLAPPPAEPPADTAPPPPAEPGVAPPAGTAGGDAVFLPGSPLAVLLRWLGYLGLLGMVGAAAFRLAVLPRAERGGLPPDAAGAAGRRLRGAALAALALFALALAGRLWFQAAALAVPAGSGAALPLVLDTGWGRAWSAQAAGAAVFLVALLVFRGGGGAMGWRVAAAALAIVAAGTAYGGHAAAVERGRAAALLADGLHLLGAGAWMGTLALLLGVGIPAALRSPGARGAGVAALVRAFSPVALLGAGVAAATGVASALFHLGAPADLWGTGYGRALLVKLALLALAAAAGFRNWRVHTPRVADDPDARSLRRTVAAEVAAGVLVVLATAVLVALPPP